MKNSLMKLMLIGISTVFILGGCSKKDYVEEPPMVDGVPVVEYSDDMPVSFDTVLVEKRDKEYTNEDMIGLFNSKIEDIRSIYEKHGIEYEEGRSDPEKTGQDIIVSLENLSFYELEVPKESMIYYLGNDGYLNVDSVFAEAVIKIGDGGIKAEDFKFKDSIFNELHQLFNPSLDIASVVDKGVKQQYVDGESVVSLYFSEGLISESMDLLDDAIYYRVSINMKPNVSIAPSDEVPLGASTVYDGIGGDKISISINSSDDYSISSDAPFILSKGDKALGEIKFYTKDFYEQLPRNLENDDKAKLLFEGNLEGNDYIGASFNDSEYNYAFLIKDTNTAVVILGIESEEDFRECFGLLTIRSAE